MLVPVLLTLPVSSVRSKTGGFPGRLRRLAVTSNIICVHMLIGDAGADRSKHREIVLDFRSL